LVIGVGQSTDDIYLNWRRDAFYVIALVGLLCVMTVILAIYLARELAKRESAEKHLAALAISDGLTGLANRRHFDQVLDREWRRCTREASSLAVMMIDADHFKSYNDQNGHLAGDALLRALGVSIAESTKRSGDLGARYGGDEFAILLSGASVAEAENIAKLLRQRFSDACSKNRITVAGLSIGIAVAIPRVGDHSDKLIQNADQSLYIAKRRGRGCTVVAFKAMETASLAA
jgi:diguanylate cyclase (GGDEF)-like protein